MVMQVFLDLDEIYELINLAQTEMEWDKDWGDYYPGLREILDKLVFLTEIKPPEELYVTDRVYIEYVTRKLKR